MSETMKVRVDRHGRPVRSRLPHGRTGTLIVIGIVAVVYAVLFPLMLALDKHDARMNPVYTDIDTVGILESGYMRNNNNVVEPVDVTHPHRIRLDGERFAPAPGVRIVVEARDTGYCVRGYLASGEASSWRCGDAHTPAS